MYLVERYMKILKGYNKNPHRPEASIVERYIAVEAVEFCLDYMSKAKLVGIPKSRHEDRYEGKGTKGQKVKFILRKELLQAHLYILNNTEAVLVYISENQDFLKKNNPRMNEKSLVNEHNKTFLKWFKEKVFSDDSFSNTLKCLTNEPKYNVFTYTGYDINNFSFYTKSQDDNSTMQNSGVTLQAQSMHFSSRNDKNLVVTSTSYYGVIEDIWEISYGAFKVLVFKCKWVDINIGVRTDEMRFTMVDLSKVGHKDEPFIMANQATQVFYVKDPIDERWSVVLQDRSVHNFDDSTAQFWESLSFSTRMPTNNKEIEQDDVHATRNDHDEGI
ncbi:uncharacterized protein LOC114914885 [Cajanus cajan]|uniref:uncharacterized protein LOC114914885 n=1 Tax=Cajanus cajan TaxID=3821 RepID=UPI0010FAD131|nr:uncharacterized protein LOC114914885 [Cajanus cajan]